MQNKLEEFIESKKDSWKHHVYQQCKSWLSQGLEPRSMTRDMKWGIPVPSHIPNSEGKVLYVWFDAPIGYISATKEWALKNNQDWKDWWQNKNTKIVNFIGKDNIVFHCLIFPSILMQIEGFKWVDDVPANEFLNLEGQKISTSRNHAIWVEEFVDEYPHLIDALRFYLLSIFPEKADSDFVLNDFKTRNNSELVSIIGNFINRTLSLIQKYFNGKINTSLEINKEISKEVNKIIDTYKENMEKYEFKNALRDVLELARIGNKYLSDKEPWKLGKENFEKNKNEIEKILNTSLFICQKLQWVLTPILPNSSSNLKKLLSMDIEQRLPKPSLLFPIIEDLKLKSFHKNKL